jgi:hypothetical protein
MRLMMHVLRIALKLLETHRIRIVNAGRRRARQMLEEYEKPEGVFSWAPRMRECLYRVYPRPDLHFVPGKMRSSGVGASKKPNQGLTVDMNI